jgi:regulator of sigma E protease
VTAALKQAEGREVRLQVAPPRHSEPLDEGAISSHDGELHARDRARELTLRGGSADALGLEAAQTVIGYLEAGSPAASAGLQVGDQVLALDGEPVGSYLALIDRLRKPYDEARADDAARGLDGDALLAHLGKALKPRTVRVRRVVQDQASELDVLVQPLVRLDRNERPQLRFGAGPMQRYEGPEMIPNASRLRYAALQTRDEMTEAIRVTVLTVAGLFRGHVPVKEVGGPIFMAQLASRTADLGWGYFFKLMVWLSVNLAILNLLPIPIADGGHLFFLAIEAVRREPVSLRTRMVAAYVGMTFLALLFVVVMKNDFQRLIASLANG